MPKLILGKVVGNDGKDGKDGERGSKWYTGNSITGKDVTPKKYTSTGIVSALIGDIYLNTETGDIYECTFSGNSTTALWKYSFTMMMDREIDNTYELNKHAIHSNSVDSLAINKNCVEYKNNIYECVEENNSGALYRNYLRDGKFEIESIVYEDDVKYKSITSDSNMFYLLKVKDRTSFDIAYTDDSILTQSTNFNLLSNANIISQNDFNYEMNAIKRIENLLFVLGNGVIMTIYKDTSNKYNISNAIGVLGHGAGRHNISDIAYDGKGKYISVGDTIYSSTDGLNWEAISDLYNVMSNSVGISQYTNGYFKSIAYGNGYFVAVGDTIGSYGGFVISNDGINFKPFNKCTIEEVNFSKVIYSNKLKTFLATGNNGKIYKLVNFERPFWDEFYDVYTKTDIVSISKNIISIYESYDGNIYVGFQDIDGLIQLLPITMSSAIEKLYKSTFKN